MKCPFNCENKNDIPELNDADEHLVVVINKTGHIHTHGPFANEYVMNKIVNTLLVEMRKNGITFTLLGNQDKD